MPREPTKRTAGAEAKFGLQFCLKATDVFGHTGVLRTEQTQLAVALVEGMLITGGAGGHGVPIKLWGLRNWLWLILGATPTVSWVNIHSTIMTAYLKYLNFDCV